MKTQETVEKPKHAFGHIAEFSQLGDTLELMGIGDCMLRSACLDVDNIRTEIWVVGQFEI